MALEVMKSIVDAEQKAEALKAEAQKSADAIRAGAKTKSDALLSGVKREAKLPTSRRTFALSWKI